MSLRGCSVTERSSPARLTRRAAVTLDGHLPRFFFHQPLLAAALSAKIKLLETEEQVPPVSTTPWDASTQKKFKQYTQLLLGFILGAIVFLPSIVGLTKPPLFMPWAVPVTLSLITLSVACLGVAMLYSFLGSPAPPFRLIGAGTWSGLGGLFLLFAFVIANLLVDSASRPVIIAMSASPIGVAPGKYVDLDVEASDKSGERLNYLWTFQGKPISSLRNAYLKAPDIAGTFPVTVRVSNERVGVQGTLNLEVILEKQTPSTATTTNPSTPDTATHHGGKATQESDSDQHAQRTGPSGPK